ncbi:branched-chain amino acid ABC transporter permease [Sulfobacillus sp. DSM 109850]|uniref:Branched-chain amino acid ABC transporter permease n=1 Tax=Sulfobacillus harzensis TaxID=2729629 RepID=A0A7Y0L3R9_9FIRM|nr:branched-chain amino acid ABC transporter permease [Sulfobacillus harzensis]
MLAYSIIGGILFGFFYALLGLGLNLVFGVLKMVNLAHGDFVMLGAYGAYVAYSTSHINPLITILAEIVAFGIVGMALYYGIVPRLLKSQDPEMLSLILFFGVSQAIEALATLAFGQNTQTMNPNVFGNHPLVIFGQQFETAWWVSVLVSAVALALLYLFLYRSKLGRATRAVMGNREETAASGINVNRVSAIAFGIGLALAGIAGALTPFMLGGIYTTMGVGITVTSFAIIVIGALGNPLGTIIGGVVYGVAQFLMQSYLPSWSAMAPFVLLLIILLVRPGGILGKGARYA